MSGLDLAMRVLFVLGMSVSAATGRPLAFAMAAVLLLVVTIEQHGGNR